MGDKVLKLGAIENDWLGYYSYDIFLYEAKSPYADDTAKASFLSMR